MGWLTGLTILGGLVASALIVPPLIVHGAGSAPSGGNVVVPALVVHGAASASSGGKVDVPPLVVRGAAPLPAARKTP